MNHVIIWCRNHPVAVLVLLSSISVFFLVEALTHTTLDASIDGMIIKNNQDYEDYLKTRKEFITDNISVVYIKDDKIFTNGTLKAIDDVFFTLEETPGVVRIDSLFNVRNFNGTGSSLEISPLIQYIPEDDEEDDLKSIRENAVRNPLLARNLISEDGSTTVINVLAENTEGEKNFNMRMAANIERALKKLEGKVERVFQIGTPYRRDLISRSILGDLSTLIPLALVVVLLVLVLVLKNLNSAFIPILTGGISILWTLGFMALIGIPVTILTAIVPPMLLALGCTEDIHIISEYFEGLEKGFDRNESIAFLAPQIGNAILLTGITTFLGCLSIAFNDITLLKQFGIASSFGIIANFVITISLIPVYLRFFGNKRPPTHYSKSSKFINESIPLFLTRVVLYRKKSTILIAFLIVALLAVGVPQVRVDNSLKGYFRQDSPIRKRSDELNKKIAGSEIFFTVLEAPENDAFRKPEYLDMILDIQNFIKNKGDFDLSLSVADHVALIESEVNKGNRQYYRIPGNEENIAQHLLLFHSHDLDRYVNHDFNKANIIVRHSISSSHDLKKALASLDKYIQSHYEGKVSTLFTGENILLLNAADTMALGLAKSLTFMFLLIFILISLLFRNVYLGLVSLIPNAVPVVMIFGVMGHLGIPLNTGTTMIAVISIGVAIDDTIHLMTRFKQAFKTGSNFEKAVPEVIKAEIRPVFASSLALTAGFMILSQSNFLPVASFGILSGCVIIFAFFADLILTPIMITFIQKQKNSPLPAIQQAF